MSLKASREPVPPDRVPCDVCRGVCGGGGGVSTADTLGPVDALKSCPECLLSYCETHLEPHRRDPLLKRHALIHPAKNLLEDCVCRTHDRHLELYCQTDGARLCRLCAESAGDHAAHRVVSASGACGGARAELRRTEAEILRMIRERGAMIQELKSYTARRRKLEQAFAAKQAKYKKAREEQAEAAVEDVRRDIVLLEKRISELRELSSSKDNLRLLKNFRSVSAYPLPAKDRVQTEQKQAELPSEVMLWMAKGHAVDVTLDPDTAHPDLVLSSDGKRVRLGNAWRNLPNVEEAARGGASSPRVAVFGKQGFSAGRFYFEVGVRGKTEWTLGVAKESAVDRNGGDAAPLLRPSDGYWTISLRNGREYSTNLDPPLFLKPKEEIRKVGVYVDYEKGMVTFYDVEVGFPFGGFSVLQFAGTLRPYFSPGLSYGGRNHAPLIISPVSDTVRVQRHCQHLLNVMDAYANPGMSNPNIQRAKMDRLVQVNGRVFHSTHGALVYENVPGN